MNRFIISTMAFVLVSFTLLAPQTSEARRVDMRGELNPEFKGRKFNTFAISAINTVPDFRFQFERRMYDLFRRHYNGKTNLVEFHKYGEPSKFDPSATKMDKIKVIEDLKQKKIEVLVIFNVHSQGGDNLPDQMTLDEAIEASINHKHDISSVTRYVSSTVTLYEISTGKIIWKGQGKLRAKINSRKWFKKSAKIQTVRLYKYIVRAGMLPPSYYDELYEDDGD